MLTDHKQLVTVFRSNKGISQKAACHLTRWAIVLMNYRFTIQYKSIKDFAQADVLSRLPRNNPEPFEMQFDKEESDDELWVKQLVEVANAL